MRKSLLFQILFLFLVFGLSFTSLVYSQTITTIAVAREDLDHDLIPDHKGDTLTVQGVVIGPNYQTSNWSYYIWDGTGGIDAVNFGTTDPVVNLGDEITITGEIDHYRGLTEIIALVDSSIVVGSSGNPVPDPLVLTVADYLADPEAYESTLIAFVNMDKTSGTWPSAGSSATLGMSDGTGTLDYRIDSDTDVDDNPEPTWPKDLIGIGSQYSSGSTVYDNGYQLLPRYYATDILAAGTLPVEFTSFTANVNDNSVLLNWNTATETNNRGFEVQRNSGTGYKTIRFVQGQGTTTQPHSYSYTDQNIAAGQYTYRLKQIDFNGTSSFSSEQSVEIYPVSYSLEQNYPNPFNPGTIINFNLKVDSKVSLKVFNVLGQEVAQLINGAITAGNHQVDFNASMLNSGIYFYRLEAAGIDGSTFSSVKKMMLTK